MIYSEMNVFSSTAVLHDFPMDVPTTAGNKGKTWAARYMVCLVASDTQSTYIDNPRYQVVA